MNEELIAQQEDAWRESFDTPVTSPRLREILTPDYRFGCRRPLVSNTYYQAFQKPTVTAIGGSIERILPDGVVTTEADQINVDTIIFATGFDAQSMLGSLRIDNGRGQRLEEAWKDRPRAYLCTLVKDFPNLFLINGPNAGGPAVTDVITAQAAYIARGNCSSWYRTGGGDGQVFTHWPGTITSLREALAQAPDSHLIITAPAGPAT
jgi:cation diffusion facilitator CzcD-associated flavoprotein CzcO